MNQSPSPKKALLYSALVHGVVFIILVLSFEFSSPPLVVSNTDANVVNAIALIDSPLIAPPTKRPEEKPVIKPDTTPPEPTPALEKPASANMAAATPAAASAPSQAPTPEKTLAIADPKKPLPEKQLKNHLKNDLSKQLLADLEDEISKQAKAKQKVIKNKFSQELKTQSEKALQQLMKEQKPAASRRSQHMQGVIDKFKAQILQAIGQQWVIPAHVDKRLSCELLINLAPGGVVLDVRVTKGSGDPSLDRSARAAVFKASPLPVPTDIYSFEPFREFVLKVKPENILENSGDQGFWIGSKKAPQTGTLT